MKHSVHLAFLSLIGISMVSCGQSSAPTSDIRFVKKKGSSAKVSLKDNYEFSYNDWRVSGPATTTVRSWIEQFFHNYTVKKTKFFQKFENYHPYYDGKEKYEILVTKVGIIDQKGANRSEDKCESTVSVEIHLKSPFTLLQSIAVECKRL